VDRCELALRRAVVVSAYPAFTVLRAIRFRCQARIFLGVFCHAAAPSPSEAPESYQPPPATAAEAIAYSRAQHHLYFFDFAYGLADSDRDPGMPRGSALPRLGRARNAAPLSPSRFVRAVAAAYDRLREFADVSIWQHCLDREFQQSIEGWAAWLLDWLKGEALGMVLAIFLVWILFAVLRRSPRRWWFYFWLASLPILIFLLFISPFVLEPLVLRLQAARANAAALAVEIEQLVHHGGLDDSAKPHLRNDRQREIAIRQCLRHGHRRVETRGRVGHHDCAHDAAGNSFRRRPRNGPLRSASHPEGNRVSGRRAADLFLARRSRPARAAGVARRPVVHSRARRLGFAAGSFAAALLSSAFFSRRSTTPSAATSSTRPINSALEVIHGIVPDAPEVAARAFEILGEVDLEEPQPSWIDKIWFEDHPSIDERIRFARSYDPWSKGEAPGVREVSIAMTHIETQIEIGVPPRQLFRFFVPQRMGYWYGPETKTQFETSGGADGIRRRAESAHLGPHRQARSIAHSRDHGVPVGNCARVALRGSLRVARHRALGFRVHRIERRARNARAHALRLPK
jgi:STE24 endopeptidase